MEIDSSSSSSSSTITLRPFKLSDVDDLMIWASDDRVTRYITWKTFTSKEEALTHIKDVCIPHPWYRSRCIRDRSIGFIWIYPGSGDERCRADIGYAVAVEFWGQGVASKALKIAISEALKNFPEVVRLQAYVVMENKASQRVLEKVGFLQEGILRKHRYLKGQIMDLYIYSFLSTDSSDKHIQPFKSSDVNDFR